jgi:putative protease
VHARFGKKRGFYLGEVARVEGERVFVQLEGPIKPGDGVVFDAGHPEEKEEGGRIYEIRRNGLAELRFGHGDINFQRVHVGDKLWKTSDPELDRRLRETFAGDTPKFQRPISIEVHGVAGKPLTLIVRDELGHVVRLESGVPLVVADKQPLTTERLREQLGRVGGTPFKLDRLENSLEGAVLLPVSELNRLRREAVKELEVLRAQPKRWTIEEQRSEVRGQTVEPSRDGLFGVHPLGCAEDLKNDADTLKGGHQTRPDSSSHSTAHLIVLVRNLAQLEATLAAKVETIYCEFEDPKKYREAVVHFRNSAHRTSHSALFVAPPRIFKMGEEWILKQVRSCEADGYLLRNYDHLRFFEAYRRVGDYSLNVANSLAADYFKNRFALERLTASYDLNFTQLEAMLRAAPPEWFEVTIHQHIPMFHMEHCVFCAFLSEGTDYTNCGRPCDKHDVKLRDRVGAEHSLKADIGCRNTLFNSRAQTGADYVARMLELGVRNFRVEFLNESPQQVSQIISRYRQLLSGKITGTQLWRELKLLNQLGVTRGQLAGSGSA